MKLPPAEGIVAPPFLPPINPADLEPLPKLTAIPGRVVTPSLFSEVRPDERAECMRDLMLRVEAEHARMRRLLPEPPAGMRWEVEIQSREADYNFLQMRADLIVRLVYRLRPIAEA